VHGLPATSCNRRPASHVATVIASQWVPSLNVIVHHSIHPFIKDHYWSKHPTSLSVCVAHCMGIQLARTLTYLFYKHNLHWLLAAWRLGCRSNLNFHHDLLLFMLVYTESWPDVGFILCLACIWWGTMGLWMWYANLHLPNSKRISLRFEIILQSIIEIHLNTWTVTISPLLVNTPLKHSNYWMCKKTIIHKNEPEDHYHHYPRTLITAGPLADGTILPAGWEWTYPSQFVFSMCTWMFMIELFN